MRMKMKRKRKGRWCTHVPLSARFITGILRVVCERDGDETGKQPLVRSVGRLKRCHGSDNKPGGEMRPWDSPIQIPEASPRSHGAWSTEEIISSVRFVVGNRTRIKTKYQLAYTVYHTSPSLGLTHSTVYVRR